MLTVHDLLIALAQRLESGPLRLGGDNLCRVQVDDLELDIEWLEEERAAFVYVPIGELPKEQNSALLQQLMEANLFFQRTTDQALFGLDSEQQIFLFQRFCIDSLSEKHFVFACVAMIELAKVWQQKLSENIAQPKEIASLALFSKF